MAAAFENPVMSAAFENNLSCAICLELFDDPRILPCGHSYCLKCLMDLSKKMFNKRAITCPICQAESSFENNIDAVYTKNYELNSLAQSIILDKRTRDRTGDTFLCEMCDQRTPAGRACVECETTYCEKCFNAFHPMKGKFRAHKIVNAGENFKSKIDLKKDDSNMYCSDCEALIAGTDISKHRNHDVMSLKEAHSLFKDKLDEATGNINTMQSDLNGCLEKSKAKFELVASVFEEIELTVTRRKEEVLAKLRADVKEAECAIDYLAPAISTYRELQERTDTISFIKECRITLRRSSLKSDFDEVRRMFERIDGLTCNNESVLRELMKLEICEVPEMDGPKITKLSPVIQGRKSNKVVLEWTTIPDAESYRIFSKVNASTWPIATTKDEKCVIENIDGTDITELWVTAMVNGRDSRPSASVTVPTITLPNLLFDHKRAGAAVRVSRNGRKTACATLDAQHLSGQYPQAKNALPNKYTVLGNSRMTAGRPYWVVEAVCDPGGWISSVFGVTSLVRHEDIEPGSDAASWAVHIHHHATTTIRMMHADQCLHEEVCGVRGESKQHIRQYGLLLDIDNRLLSVFDVDESKCLYTFTNVDTSRGVWPIFAVYEYDNTFRLLAPDVIQYASLLTFYTSVP